MHIHQEERENDPQLQQRMRSEWGTSTNLPMISGLGKMAITSWYRSDVTCASLGNPRAAIQFHPIPKIIFSRHISAKLILMLSGVKPKVLLWAAETKWKVKRPNWKQADESWYRKAPGTPPEWIRQDAADYAYSLVIILVITNISVAVLKFERHAPISVNPNRPTPDRHA